MLLAATACTPTLPTSHPVERALVRDVARVAEGQAQIRWLIDEIEVRDALPDVLDSACRVTPEQRESALRWLDEAVEAAGGDPAVAWEANGHDLDALEPLLLLVRARQLLTEANAWARDGKCPFWLKPEPDFSGLQGYADAFLVAVETGGRFYVQWEDGEPGFGGGGGARVLLGRGLSDRLTLMTGIEIGGAGRFTDVQFGERVEIPAVLLVGAIPVQARLHGLSDHLDLEVAPLSYINQLRGESQLGLRLGVGYGISQLALRGLIPGATFAIGYDWIPASGDLPAVHQLGGGLRAGVALPW